MKVLLIAWERRLMSVWCALVKGKPTFRHLGAPHHQLADDRSEMTGWHCRAVRTRTQRAYSQTIRLCATLRLKSEHALGTAQHPLLLLFRPTAISL